MHLLLLLFFFSLAPAPVAAQSLPSPMNPIFGPMLWGRVSPWYCAHKPDDCKYSTHYCVGDDGVVRIKTSGLVVNKELRAKMSTNFIKELPRCNKE